MASQEIGLVPPKRFDNGLSSQLVFHDQGLRFSCDTPQPRVGGPGPKTRELSGFIDDRYFQPQGAAEFRRSIYGGDDHHRQDHHQESQNWNRNGRASSGDGSEGNEEEEEEDDDDDEEDDDDEVDEGDGEVEALVGVDDCNNKNHNSNNTSEHSNTDTIGNGKSKHFSSYVGSNRGVLIKECNVLHSGSDYGNARATPNGDHHQRGRLNQYQNEVRIVDPDGELYYSHYLQGPEGSGRGQKGLVVENGCGFSGRKEGSCSSESGESLRVILSDPLTGALMEDAMILPCGHSFGSDGIQHVIRMKACYTCSQPVSKESVSPNLSLRAAVQAFHREEELQVYRSSKRRRERFEQDKGSYDAMPMDHPRSRGVQFPFAVADRVIIKGNKRTPQRFVGREAIVTTQCLNGWYVVKTLDNAESVKLQYRSLAKVSDNPSSKPATSKMTPNWL